LEPDEIEHNSELTKLLMERFENDQEAKRLHHLLQLIQTKALFASTQVCLALVDNRTKAVEVNAVEVILIAVETTKEALQLETATKTQEDKFLKNTEVSNQVARL
ncbi:MAG: hypothetical protein AAF963_02205, partial [Bacteroidota bacterium]